MLLPFLLMTALAAQEPALSAPPAKTVKSLSFTSGTFPFQWDKTLPLDLEVDGLKVTSIFFNEREPKSGPLKGTTWGTRAQVEVTNTAKATRKPGFAVAVLDAEGSLLGVASGGLRLGTLKPGETESFDLDFSQVKLRLRRGAKFILSVELKD